MNAAWHFFSSIIESLAVVYYPIGTQASALAGRCLAAALANFIIFEQKKRRKKGD